MKLLNAATIRAADQYTIAQEPIASIDLMERAAQRCVEWIAQSYSKENTFSIICGTGNNGGDGMAIARLLINKGYSVNVFWVKYSSSISEDCQINVERLVRLGIAIQLIDDSSLDRLNLNVDLIVDALFGTGLNKPVYGITEKVIEKLNASYVTVISIDIPSGLMCEDNSTNRLDCVVKANFTLTFQQPKLSFLLPDTGRFVGEFIILDIGLDESFLADQETNYTFLALKDVHSILAPRSKFSHKGTYGHALLCAGSYGKMGAAILAGKAALRSGVGLLTMHIPAYGIESLHTSIPEAMVIADMNYKLLSTGWEQLEGYTALGVGPGIGTQPETVSFLKDIIHAYNQPMVIDADALNIIGNNLELLSEIPKNSILTPHLKEFKRLLQLDGEYSSYEILQLQRAWCQSHQQILLLKGAHTSICFPNGKVWFNSTGNPGMAKGGSGDVLTGILTSLLAQGIPPHKAALLGVYMHGLAGDGTSKFYHENAMVASDIIENISAALNIIKKASL
jgi:ADP-dependent NAD(P)H-hydrate dehydratase / NAD(P)H-hydrate epimerase